MGAFGIHLINFSSAIIYVNDKKKPQAYTLVNFSRGFFFDFRINIYE